MKNCQLCSNSIELFMVLVINCMVLVINCMVLVIIFLSLVTKWFLVIFFAFE